jgi:N12 class adenine-specific DNA methylase
MYGNENSATCIPIEGAELAEQLKTALSHIEGQIIPIETELVVNDIGDIDLLDLDDSNIKQTLPADPSVKNFSYTIVDETVYFRENSVMRPVDMPAATLERVKGMVGLRDAAKELIDLQLYDGSEEQISAKQAELNSLYDDFTRKNGLINTNANARAFNEDSSYYLLASLEVLDENGELERKSDIFTKRTIKQEQEITSVDTSSEALAVSISRRAKVDMEYMAELTGLAPDKIIGDLQGVIFCDIGNPNNALPPFDPETMKLYEKFPFVTADEYLSGNVREKLEKARLFNEYAGDEFHGINTTVNIAALSEAQPKDLDASEIAVRLGSTWVDKEYYQQFAYELLQTPSYQQNSIKVNYAELTGEWNIAGKTVPSYNDPLVYSAFGTERANAYKILEDSLNLRDVRIYDTKIEDGKETRVLNKKETTLALQKQDVLKEAFKEWIFKDPDRRQDLVAKYNKLFNSTRTRQYDGSHIEFAGASPEITLRPHQRGAIARILYGGNTLLAHEVGAGKSFEMIGAAMESKRLGLCNKSMLVVPNHILEDMASEFMRLYPSANILVASKKDFEPKNRKKFCARIATGEYDCVIIGHSQFEKIPLSAERQERLLQEQIDELTVGIKQLKDARGERFTIKQMEKSKKNLEVRLAKLTDDSRKDTVVTFEQLGVDRLFIDEAHFYKNLFLVAKMRNVAGLSTSEAQKSSDLFMKCRYLDELTGGKGVIFATGTPISNSLAEMYTMQRYLQYDTLQAKNLSHFDQWASTFGETVTAVELAPEGSGYRARTRFAKFQNLPELMTMFGDVADIKTADTLDLLRPKANYHVVVAEPTEIQREMVAELSERATAVQRKEVDPSQDNMLCITSDGRKIGLDQRMMNPMLPDDPNSKVNLCAQNVFRIWEETAENRSTQIIFCDFSTPNKDGRFNVYTDIKDKLLNNGVPENEIAFIHDYSTEAQKKELFAKVRSGKVRVLFGSTAKCGSGTNVQDRLIALHDLDCPWRPADLAQRAGRIERQGNQNPEADISRHVTDPTFDSYLFQTVQKKQEFISQIMTSKSPVRTCDDMDEQALSYAEIKALCAGYPLIAEKMGLDVEVAKLKMLKANHQSQQYRLEDNLRLNFPKQIESTKANIEGYKADIERLEINTVRDEEGISPMTIGANSFSERKDAGAALIEACRNIEGIGSDKVGSYRGFEMSISFDTFNKEYKCHLKGAITHTVPLGSDPAGNIIRIDNAFEKLPALLNSAEAKLETLYSQVENAKVELTRPFPQEAELAEKSARLTELDSLLNLDGKDEPDAEARDGDTPVADANVPLNSVTEKVSQTEFDTDKPPQDKVKKKSHDER